jgi:small subunit ribosomal protein S1
VKVGDRLEATVTSTDGGVTLSRRLQRGAATARLLESAFHTGLPVEGKVEREVKGGFEVTIAKLRAFCPASQIDIARWTDAAVHLGRVYTFRIIEFGEGGRKFVVSRRALLEEEQKARAADVRRALTPGALVTGVVASVRHFGAFIDLGAGVQGLLHVSEMGWTRVEAAAAVTPGQHLTVKVLRVDESSGQIALSLKQLLADPWQGVAATYTVGQLRQGRVARVADFGVFVELEPAVVGLIPRSEAGVGPEQDLRKAFPIGNQVNVIVLEIDAGARRLRLSVSEITKAEEAADVRDYAARQDDTPSEQLGSLADKLRGALGRRQS